MVATPTRTSSHSFTSATRSGSSNSTSATYPLRPPPCVAGSGGVSRARPRPSEPLRHQHRAKLLGLAEGVALDHRLEVCQLFGRVRRQLSAQCAPSPVVGTPQQDAGTPDEEP